MERIRTFIAVTPPEDIRGDIAKVVDGLKATNHNVDWEEPGKEHITLSFLGNISQARMEQAAKAVQDTASSFPKFTLQTDQISYFYKDKQSLTLHDKAGSDSVIFLSIYDPAKNLRQLHKLLARNLAEREFSPSTHFSAHITIGRLKKQRYPHEQKRILSEIADTNLRRGSEFEVTNLNLYESISQGDGHRHHLLRSFELAG